MARGESFENAAWLANMRIAIENRRLFEPTDNEIQKMCAKIGDSPLFANLSDANKAELFRVMLTLRLKLKAYDIAVQIRARAHRPAAAGARGFCRDHPPSPRPSQRGR
jgi:hypothetical protein